jgi:PleD family two-component response regulator
LLVNISVGDVTASLPGRVVRGGASEGARVRVEFGEHDWQRLLELADGAPPESVPPPSRQTPPESVTPPPGTEVLLVHDDPEVAALLDRMLRQSGFSVTLAASPREAVTCLSSKSPQIVLADWDPNDPEAAELCALLKRPSEAPRPSLVYLACPSCRADRDRALAAGADDFVVLPFRWRELGVRLLSLVPH